MPRVNVFQNVDALMLAGLKKLCEDDGGSLRADPQRNGSFVATCALPETPAAAGGASRPDPAGPDAATGVAVGTGPGNGTEIGTGVGTGDAGDAVRIDVTPTDLDALQRVAHSEVGHFAKHGPDQLRGALAAVVDTIFNRVAHPGHPDTIVAVIDKPAQFSAINPLGTWSKLSPAPPAVAQIVADHVRDRAAGKSSEIGGATHFLNPHLSSASAMAAWGRFLVNNAVRIYGNDEKHDVHFHGFPPGGTLPPPYVVSFAGQAAMFDPSGRSLT